MVRMLGTKYENKLRSFIKEIEQDEKNLIIATRKEGGISPVNVNMMRKFRADVSNVIPKLIYMKNVREPNTKEIPIQ